LGFASQTSVSNIISGIFLIAEEPFEVGDVIEVGTTRGEVLSVDLISVKVRTFDNRLVRIPNETLVKTEITNLTKFPIRRLDITVSIAYKEDFQRVKNILLDIARKNQYCLQEPEALVHLTAFAESAVSILFAVWTPTSERARVKSLIQEEVKARFDKEGIEIPFPHLSLYAGSKSEPFEVRIERTPA
ncbi:MAG: mechanosensitive ion channel family protein, partial [Bdellovibrionales bacterium]|nr:mechanosensitive ion channel family protein [Bdellovibrionales bacterium]